MIANKYSGYPTTRLQKNSVTSIRSKNYDVDVEVKI